MMKAYISVSFGKRKVLEPVIKAVLDSLKTFHIDGFVFVDHYKFDKNDEQKMMQQAMKDIDCCDILLAETTEKGIGIGVEVGYAKGKGKPVIYLRHYDAEHSTTVSGISDFHIVYKDVDDLSTQFIILLSNLINNE